MPPTPPITTDGADRPTPPATTAFTPAHVRAILGRHGLDGDAARILTTAEELARRDADSAQHHAARSQRITVTLATQLKNIFAFAGLALPWLLQLEHTPPVPDRAWPALAVFATVGVLTYLHTSWTTRPDLPRRPRPASPGWLSVVGMDKKARTPQHLHEHYILRAVDPLTHYARETGDNGDVAHRRYRRNQYTTAGIALTTITGLACVLLLLPR